MKHVNKEVKLEAEYAAVSDIRTWGDGTALIELGFTTKRERAGVETETTYRVTIRNQDIDSLACVGRSFIRAAKRSRTQVINRADEAVNSLREALNG